MMTGCRNEHDPKHVATCDECSVATNADAWMRSFAAIDDREHMLPNPSLVYLKAQLLQQTRTVDRATRPMSYVQTGAYVAIAACWALLLMVKWNAIVALAQTLTPSRFVMAATNDPSIAQLSMTSMLVFMLLASATAMLALHTILAED